MIYALRGPSFREDPEGYRNWTSLISTSLQEGVGRFGWSYVETADLRQLERRITERGWDDLNDDEQCCYQEFLLHLERDDYVIYINLPEPGKCTLARVSGPYFWEWDGEGSDFNHRFHVCPNSILEFNRNDAIVPRSLYARLGLPRKYWRIYLPEQVERLAEALNEGRGGTPSTPETRLESLRETIRPFLAEITSQIHQNYPGNDLEELIAEVFRKVPNVKEVREQGGSGERGADLIVTYESGLPIPELQGQHTCVVQVKSYEGEQRDPHAVEQIREALEHWDADAGLIVSTASSRTTALDDALDQLREETEKPVGLLIGEDLAAFVLRFGGDLLI